MIDSIHELSNLLKLCRKQGVTEIQWGGFFLKLGDLPIKRPKQDDSDEIESDGPTDEDLMLWAVEGKL